MPPIDDAPVGQKVYSFGWMVSVPCRISVLCHTKLLYKIFQASKEVLMKKHFKKKSIYNITQVQNVNTFASSGSSV